jgi:hypothetical protein
MSEIFTAQRGIEKESITYNLAPILLFGYRVHLYAYPNLGTEHMKKLVKNISIALAVVLGAAGVANAAPTYTYVGSWIVGDGPVWTDNPSVYSGQSAAAFLFGGTPDQYVTSTVDSNVANINFRTFLDGWGDTQYLTNPQSDTFSLSSNGGGYNQFPAYSAFVLDHTCDNRYDNLSQACSGDGTQYVNYAFRVTDVPGNDVPEPVSIALFGAGLAGVGYTRRKKIKG